MRSRALILRVSLVYFLAVLLTKGCAVTLNIPNFSKAHVLVVGDLMLDRYWFGSASRISPEAPVPVMRVDKADDRAGGAGNVALNLVALGAQTSFVSLVGEDKNAEWLDNFLREVNIASYLHPVPDVPTITKLRVISQHQQLVRLDFEEKFDEDASKALLPVIEEQLASADVLVLSDYGKGTLRDPQAFIRLAKKAKVPVFVDPKSLDFSVYKGATLLTPNLKEFVAVVGPCETEEEMAAKAFKLIRQFNLEYLLVTRGEQGMSLYYGSKEVVHLPTEAQEVFDVTGAGDTVIATLAAAYAAGADLVDAVKLSNCAAGITVGKLGAAAIQPHELRRAIHQLHLGGVLSEDELFLAIQDAKAHGEKIVMTNGCFDILHAGHVHYLNQARSLGDRLIVAVNDDASVRRLKGESRPINPIEDRMEVLAGLASVDWVVKFSEDTPERVICRLLPDVLVKGGDWKPAQIAGSQCVLENGGEVQSLDFVDGKSTTHVINKVKG